MRNYDQYTMMYSGAEAEFIKADAFKIISPLSFGSMTKVGPGLHLWQVRKWQIRWSTDQGGGAAISVWSRQGETCQASCLARRPPPAPYIVRGKALSLIADTYVLSTLLDVTASMH